MHKLLIYCYNQSIPNKHDHADQRVKTMSTMQTSIKGYIMVTTSKDGNQKTIVQALSIAEAKRILKQQTSLDWYFKGYTGN